MVDTTVLERLGIQISFSSAKNICNINESLYSTRIKLLKDISKAKCL